jgi:multimeric flavodoxin WrbA
MKVIAFNGSPRKEGNTYQALKLATDRLEDRGIEVEMIQVGSQVIRGCMACNRCAANKDGACVLKDDQVNEWIKIMTEADGFILGSPVHFAGIGGTMKSFLDRAFYVSTSNANLFRHKIGAAVVAVRRSGGSTTFNSLNNYLNYSEMMLPSSNYWNIIHGTKPGDIHDDAEGVEIIKVLGDNMADLLHMKNDTEITMNPQHRKVYTSFVR